jgi:hypothetical protein
MICLTNLNKVNDNNEKELNENKIINNNEIENKIKEEIIHENLKIEKNEISFDDFLKAKKFLNVLDKENNFNKNNLKKNISKNNVIFNENTQIPQKKIHKGILKNYFIPKQQIDDDLNLIFQKNLSDEDFYSENSNSGDELVYKRKSTRVSLKRVFDDANEKKKIKKKKEDYEYFDSKKDSRYNTRSKKIDFD